MADVRVSKLTVLATVGVTLAALFASSGCRPEEPAPDVVIRPVRFVVAEATQESATRTFSGVAQSGVASSLSFRVSGNVENVAVQVGDNVSEGDLIAQLDTADYDVAVDAAQADTSAARAQQRNAEAEYARVRQLYESGAASRSDLDAARAASESATAQVRAARQSVQRARDQVEYCTLNSPVGGQIANVNVEVNENVQAGQPIVVLTSGADEQLEVETTVPETVIPRIRQGMPVNVGLNALPGRSFEGTVTEVGVAAGAMGATFPVTVQLADPDPDIRSGMAADVTFEFGDVDSTPRYWLPPHAVSEDTDGRFVYVVNPSAEGAGVGTGGAAGEGLGTIERRPVGIGELDNRGLEITSGVEDGDRVVTAGVSRISDGMTVRLSAPGVD